jgi:tRNA-splicing ligase RtcB
MSIKQSSHEGKVPVHLWTEDVEQTALEQLLNVSRLPIVHPHVAAMPDVHVGIGATVGSVIPTRGAIVPAAVGVDIGCGMNAIRLSLRAEQLPDSLRRVRNEIECRKDKGVIDEIPGVYKDIDQVMADQSDLVEVVHTLKQVLCVKG